MQRYFNEETIIIKGWETSTTLQIAERLQEYIEERVTQGYRVRHVICGNANIQVPCGGKNVSQEYLWEKLLNRFSKNPKGFQVEIM